MSREEKGRFKGSTSIIFIAGTILAGLISFMNAPVITRCLTAETYVEYSMFMSLSSVITAISYIGYDSAYMRFYHKNDGFKFLIICLMYPLAFWGVISLALIMLRQSALKYILGAPVSIIECILLIVYLLVKLLARFSLLTMRMETKAWNYVISDCLERLIFIVAVIITKYVLGHVLFSTVLVCFIIGYAVEIMINLIGFSDSHRSLTNTNLIVSTNTELFRYGVFLGITNCIMFCIPLIQKVVVRSLLEKSAAAVYFAASIFQTAISLISISINNIWEPKVYRITNEGGNLKLSFHRYGVFVSWLLLTILGFVIALRRILVYVLAEQYYYVYIIAPCVTLSACMTIIYNFYSIGIEIEKKTWIRNIIPIIELVVSVSLFYLLSRRFNIRGVAAAMLIGSVVSKAVGIDIGLKLFDTGQKLSIPMICWSSALLFAFLSLIFDSLLCDIVFGLVAIAVGFITARKTICQVVMEIAPNPFGFLNLRRENI